MKETIKKFIDRQKQYYERQNSFWRMYYIIMAMLIAVAVFFAIVFLIHIEYTSKIQIIGESFVEDIAREEEVYYKKHKTFFSTGGKEISHSPEFGIDARKNILFKKFSIVADAESYRVEVKNPYDTFGKLYTIITISGTPKSRFGRDVIRVRENGWD